MTGWLTAPMAAFDLETTGVDVESDRIVAMLLAIAAATTPPEPAP